MLTKYANIAQILKENVYTDIPGQNLPAFAELVERVQDAKITSLGSVKNGFPYSSNPDYELVRSLVQRPSTAQADAQAEADRDVVVESHPDVHADGEADVDECA